MSIRSLTLIMAVFAIVAVVPISVSAQGLLPGLNNPVTDVGADTRKAEDNRRIAEFLKADTDGDGVLSRDEITALRDTLFTQLDTNANGSLTRDEFRLNRLDRPQGGAAGVFSRLDGNGDDVISRTEFIDGLIAEADINADGQLSIWEYRTQE